MVLYFFRNSGLSILLPHTNKLEYADMQYTVGRSGNKDVVSSFTRCVSNRVFLVSTFCCVIYEIKSLLVANALKTYKQFEET